MKTPKQWKSSAARKLNVQHTVEERFWSKVDIRGEDECWAWLAGKNKDGYGKVWVDGGMRLTNRVAYELTKESLGDRNACHECDMPSCCNPKHLFAGTRSDNMQDCVTKGRFGAGAANRKLLSSEIKLIRNSSMPLRYLAQLFEVDYSTVGRVKRGERYVS